MQLYFANGLMYYKNSYYLMEFITRYKIFYYNIIIFFYLQKKQSQFDSIIKYIVSTTCKIALINYFK